MPITTSICISYSHRVARSSVLRTLTLLTLKSLVPFQSLMTTSTTIILVTQTLSELPSLTHAPIKFAKRLPMLYSTQSQLTLRRGLAISFLQFRMASQRRASTKVKEIRLWASQPSSLM